jgi:hypothetical protein
VTFVDPGALMEEPDLYPKTHDPHEEQLTEAAWMSAGEAQAEHEAEQGKGDDRG